MTRPKSSGFGATLKFPCKLRVILNLLNTGWPMFVLLYKGASSISGDPFSPQVICLAVKRWASSALGLMICCFFYLVMLERWVLVSYFSA